MSSSLGVLVVCSERGGGNGNLKWEGCGGDGEKSSPAPNEGWIRQAQSGQSGQSGQPGKRAGKAVEGYWRRGRWRHGVERANAVSLVGQSVGCWSSQATMGESEGDEARKERVCGEREKEKKSKTESPFGFFFSMQLRLVYVRERKREKVSGSIRDRK